MINRKVSEEIDRVFEKMKKTKPGTDEYNALIDNLMAFDKIRLEEYKNDYMLEIEDRKMDMLEEKQNKKWLHNINPNVVILVALGFFSTLSISNRFKIFQNRKLIG